MHPVFKKMRYKGQSPVLLWNAPADFEAGLEADVRPKGKYPFLLAFARSLAELDKTAQVASKFLGDEGHFWMAYPKGTSRRYQADFNRDSGYKAMTGKGFTGVSLVAVDEDWAAMRFKRA
jgi:hypothetical protein